VLELDRVDPVSFEHEDEDDSGREERHDVDPPV
jgi:hypothetical protein